MKLFLVRHAETLENAKGIVQGYGGTISPFGKKQVMQLALRLKDEKIDHIYSSDLSRAIETVEEIGKFHQEVPLIITNKLREVDFTKYLGNSIDEIDWRNIKDLESQEDLQIRARDFYEEMRKSVLYNETVLCVGHAGILKAIKSVILGLHYDQIWDMKTPKNCSVDVFREL